MNQDTIDKITEDANMEDMQMNEEAREAELDEAYNRGYQEGRTDMEIEMSDYGDERYKEGLEAGIDNTIDRAISRMEDLR